MLGFINTGSSLDEFITKRKMPFHGVYEYQVPNNNNFGWIKYINGFCEFWMAKGTATITNYSTVNGFYGYLHTITFPFTWYEIPNITYNMQVGNGFAMPGSSILGVTVTKASLYCLATAKGSHIVPSNLYAFGKWRNIDENIYV